jgi:hypothetical protein
MCRGNRREAVFHDNRHREGFLETLGKVCAKCGFLIYSYVLMGNVRLARDCESKHVSDSLFRA